MMPDPTFWQQEAERLTQRVLELEEELASKNEPPSAEHARIVKLGHQNSIVYAVLNQIWHSDVPWWSGLVRMVETLAGVNEEMLRRLTDDEMRKPPPPLAIDFKGTTEEWLRFKDDNKAREEALQLQAAQVKAQIAENLRIIEELERGMKPE